MEALEVAEAGVAAEEGGDEGVEGVLALGVVCGGVVCWVEDEAAVRVEADLALVWVRLTAPVEVAVAVAIEGAVSVADVQEAEPYGSSGAAEAAWGEAAAAQGVPMDGVRRGEVG